MTKTSDVSHAMANHPDHQEAIVSKKKISSLKAEQKQAGVGVLNTDA